VIFIEIFNPSNGQVLIKYFEVEYNVMSNQDFFSIPEEISLYDIFDIKFSDIITIKTSKKRLKDLDESIGVLNSCTCYDIVKNDDGYLKPVNELKVFYSNDFNIVYFVEFTGVIYECPLYFIIKFRNKIFYATIVVIPKSSNTNSYHRSYAEGIFIEDSFLEGLYTIEIMTFSGLVLTSTTFHYKKGNRIQNKYTKILLKKQNKLIFNEYEV